MQLRHHKEHKACLGLVESLDIGVLRGLARLDVLKGNALGFTHSARAWAMNSGPLSKRMDSGVPRTSTNSSKARMTRAAGKLVSISMRRPSRLYSSITLNVLKRRPDHKASDMKSQLQP